MTHPAAERIQQLLGGPAYARMFVAVRRRLEEDGDEARSVLLRDLEPVERKAIAGLLGWEVVPDGALRLELDELDAALRESAADMSLRGALEALGGPIIDRRAARDEKRAARDELWASARRAIEEAGRLELLAWLDSVRRSGALSRAARSDGREPGAILELAVRATVALPAGGQLLSVFASTIAGDPHALDVGTPLAGLVLRAVATITGRAEVPGSALERRRLWREVGIDCDSVSADVLVLGMRPRGDGLLARQLRESADGGEPRRVTLRELGRSDLSFEAGARAFVCENPAVVEAAADAGARAPLICVEGNPTSAAVDLLRRMARAGVQMNVHADFDWAGVRITSQLLATTGGVPWRFSAADYHAAVAAGAVGPALAGRAVPTAWDPALCEAMRSAGVSVPEERVLGSLIADLLDGP